MQQLTLFQFVKTLEGWQFCQPFFCIIDESTRFSRMPTASTVSKSTAAKPARKTRTRKATTKKTPSVSKVTVTTYKGGKVTQKKTEFTRPSTARLITWERYQKDFQTRWQIHQYEIQELGKDIRKGFDFVSPYHAQLVKQVKAWTV